MNQPDPAENSLTWLAFCYVADELSADERAAFEARLATDQAAREAVAAAVELTFATQLVFAEAEQVALAQPASQGDTSRRGWWSVAFACGGLLALIVINQLAYRPAPQSDTADLAIAWSQARAEYGSVDPDNDGEPLVGELLLSPDELALEDDGIALPTWMVAAVSESTMNMTENPPADAIPE